MARTSSLVSRVLLLVPPFHLPERLGGRGYVLWRGGDDVQVAGALDRIHGNALIACLGGDLCRVAIGDGRISLNGHVAITAASPAEEIKPIRGLDHAGIGDIDRGHAIIGEDAEWVSWGLQSLAELFDQCGDGMVRVGRHGWWHGARTICPIQLVEHVRTGVQRPGHAARIAKGWPIVGITLGITQDGV